MNKKIRFCIYIKSYIQLSVIVYKIACFTGLNPLSMFMVYSGYKLLKPNLMITKDNVDLIKDITI